MVRVAIIFYAAVAVVAIGLNALRGAPLFPWAGNGHRTVALGVAVALALATVAFSVLAARAFAWARELEAAFRRALGRAGWREVLLLAASSSVAEELFFRGALQPALQHALGSGTAGLVAATAAFALLHVLPQKGGVLWAWTIFAFALGLVLGGLFWWSQSLAPPIALHALVNAINLRRITRARRDGRRGGEPRPAPRAVATPRQASEDAWPRAAAQSSPRGHRRPPPACGSARSPRAAKHGIRGTPACAEVRGLLELRAASTARCGIRRGVRGSGVASAASARGAERGSRQ